MTHVLYADYGKILYEWNQVDQAIQFLQTGCEKSRRTGISERAYCAAALADIWLRSGEPSKAENILSPYISLLGDESLTLWDDHYLLASVIKLFASQGRIHELDRVFLKRPYLLQDIIDVIHAPAVLATAMSYYLLHNFNASIEQAQRLETIMEDSRMIGHQIQMLVLIAASEIALGKLEDAARHLIKSLRLSMPEGYFRSYLDFGAPMMYALQQIQESGSFQTDELETLYLRDLLNSYFAYNIDHENCQKTSSRFSACLDPVLSNHLTEHEKKVLRLLVAGKNNMEIASELCISINTVKTHISNIYNKLNVHNRVEAVTR